MSVMVKKDILNHITTISECIIKNSVNSTCCYFAHQPKRPYGVNKFKNKSNLE